MPWVTRDRYFPLSWVTTHVRGLSSNTALSAPLTWRLPRPNISVFVFVLFFLLCVWDNFCADRKQKVQGVGGNRWGRRVVWNCYISEMMLEMVVSMASWKRVCVCVYVCEEASDKLKMTGCRVVIWQRGAPCSNKANEKTWQQAREMEGPWLIGGADMPKGGRKKDLFFEAVKIIFQEHKILSKTYQPHYNF